MNTYSEAPRPRRTFLATAALGITGVLMAAILGACGIVLYGMRIVDRRAGSLVDLVQHGLANLPQLKESLPPVLADIIHDERRPDYARQIETTVRMAVDERRGTVRPVVEVRNSGEELVTLLSLRIVIQNPQGEPVAEGNEWAATPVAADGDWPGPLMAGGRRILEGDSISLRGREAGQFGAHVELTDVRVWRGPQNADVPTG